MPFPPQRLIDCTVQAARGLAAAHEKGIIHRDLKPENIFITTDDRVKILDFGLAKLSAAGAGDDQSTLAGDTAAGLVLGTAGYMSPEQVRGQEVDRRSDLFSLGAVIYEMATGRRAFERQSAVEAMHNILAADVPPLDESGRVRPPVSQRLCADASRRIRRDDSHRRATWRSRSSSWSRRPAVGSPGFRRDRPRPGAARRSR